MASVATSRPFLGMRNPMAHYIPLWVLVVFLFLSVIIVTYAGQHDFGTVKFNDVDVNGTIDLAQADLVVGGNVRIDGGLSGRGKVVDVFGSVVTVTNTIDATTDVTLAQPANTLLDKLFLISGPTAITTGGTNGDSLSIVVGNAGSGTQQLITTTGLITNTGTASTIAGNSRLLLIDGAATISTALLSEMSGVAANQLASPQNTGVGLTAGAAGATITLTLTVLQAALATTGNRFQLFAQFIQTA